LPFFEVEPVLVVFPDGSAEAVVKADDTTMPYIASTRITAIDFTVGLPEDINSPIPHPR
jgi:hypothetical protein